MEYDHEGHSEPCMDPLQSLSIKKVDIAIHLGAYYGLEALSLVFLRGCQVSEVSEVLEASFWAGDCDARLIPQSCNEVKSD